MEKQPKPDALDRALTDLYRSDIPTAYRANWRTAVQREERQTMQKHRQTKTFWRIALPAAAALVLVVGALSAGNLIPTITYETLNGAPAPKAASQSACCSSSPGMTTISAIKRVRSAIQPVNITSRANPPVRMMAFTSPLSTAAQAPISFAT